MDFDVVLLIVVVAGFVNLVRNEVHDIRAMRERERAQTVVFRTTRSPKDGRS